MAKKKPIADADEAEQGHLEGMSPEKNNVIHPKIVRYGKLMAKRMEAGREEKEAKTILLETMLLEGVHHYAFGGIEAHVSDKRTIKIKTPDINADE